MGGLGGSGGVSGWWGDRVDVNLNLKFLGTFKKKNEVGVRGSVGEVGLVGGNQGGCERRIEVFVKIKKNMGGRGQVGSSCWGGGGGGQGGCE